jgi:hypothetical protein
MKKYLQMACDLGYYYASCKLVEYYGKNKNYTQMKKYYQIGINSSCCVPKEYLEKFNWIMEKKFNSQWSG